MSYVDRYAERPTKRNIPKTLPWVPEHPSKHRIGTYVRKALLVFHVYYNQCKNRRSLWTSQNDGCQTEGWRDQCWQMGFGHRDEERPANYTLMQAGSVTTGNPCPSPPQCLSWSSLSPHFHLTSYESRWHPGAGNLSANDCLFSGRSSCQHILRHYHVLDDTCAPEIAVTLKQCLWGEDSSGNERIVFYRAFKARWIYRDITREKSGQLCFFFLTWHTYITTYATLTTLTNATHIFGDLEIVYFRTKL